jgi:hypothetical protein
MKLAELNKALLGYAQEDVQLAEDNGQHAIAQTLKGLVNIACIGEVFQAFNNRNEQLTAPMGKLKMIDWTSKIYDVSEVVITD